MWTQNRTECLYCGIPVRKGQDKSSQSQVLNQDLNYVVLFLRVLYSGKVCGNWKVQAEKSKVSTQGLEYHISAKKLVFCCNMSWVNIKSSHWRGQGHRQGWDSRNLLSVLSVADLLAGQLASRIKTNKESYGWYDTPLNVKLIDIIHFFSENSFNRVLSTKYAVRTIEWIGDTTVN